MALTPCSIGLLGDDVICSYTSHTAHCGQLKQCTVVLESRRQTRQRKGRYYSCQQDAMGGTQTWEPAIVNNARPEHTEAFHNILKEMFLSHFCCWKTTFLTPPQE